MNLNNLAQQIGLNNQHPPVEQWDPPFCGDMDISIKTDGVWWYMGSPINRQPLVKLFASVLTTAAGEYFLVTPVEKVRIKVEDAPFVITAWRQQQTEQGAAIVFTTNVGDEFILSPPHPMQLGKNSQKHPLYLDIHRRLQASIHRNVYYQLAELAQQKVIAGQTQWTVQSAGIEFCIGMA